MEGLRILIIEDTKSDSDELSYALAANQHQVVGVATNYSEALKLFYENQIDLVIIDVFLNGIPEGINFAETICIAPNMAKPFIFLTSSKDRQIFERAKLTKPFSFLMKPFNELEVLYAIEMAVEKFYDQKDNLDSENQNVVLSTDYFFVKKNKSLKKVNIREIIYIEVEERFCHLITLKENFIVTLSLKKLVEYLNEDIFAKSHRNFMVNIDRINEINMKDNLIIMEGGHKVQLSDHYKGFVQRYNLL